MTTEVSSIARHKVKVQMRKEKIWRPQLHLIFSRSVNPNNVLINNQEFKLDDLLTAIKLATR
jgi:hypothetical protein